MSEIFTRRLEDGLAFGLLRRGVGCLYGWCDSHHVRKSESRRSRRHGKSTNSDGVKRTLLGEDLGNELHIGQLEIPCTYSFFCRQVKPGVKHTEGAELA